MILRRDPQAMGKMRIISPNRVDEMRQSQSVEERLAAINILLQLLGSIP